MPEVSFNKIISTILIIIISVAIITNLYVIVKSLSTGTKPGTKLNILKSEDKEVYLQVHLIAPPIKGMPPSIEVFRGKVQKSLTIGLNNKKFKKVVEEWVKLEEKRRGTAEYLEVGLKVDIWIIKSGKVIGRFTKYYKYNPYKILKGEQITIDIIIPNQIGSQKEGAQPYELPNPIDYIWIREWYLGPENASSYLELIYYGQYGPEIKVPVLIINNELQNSGVVGGSISLAMEKKTEFRVSIGYGFEIEKKVKEGDISGGLSGKIYQAGTSWSNQVSFYENTGYIYPNTAGYIYIVARPISEFWREYECDIVGNCVLTGNEKIEHYIQDVWIIGNTIQGGYEEGLPPQEVMDWILNDTLTYEQKIQISGTPTSDGDLDVDETIAFTQIFDWLDTCNADFEVGIPIGSLLAAAATFTGHPYLAAVLSGISTTLSYGESYTIFVMGGLKNFGAEAGGGIDIYEELYLRMSQFQYKHQVWFTTCYYNVPVAIYIRSY